MRSFLMLAAAIAALAAGFASADAYFAAKPTPSDYCYGYAICK